MKGKILYLLFLPLILSCNDPRENFDWLIGSWTRINTDKANTTKEIWEKIDKKEYHGLGFTLQNQDTVFKENIRLFKRDSTWIYEVTGVHEAPVEFAFSSYKEHQFVAENTQNEFPKKIVYYTENGQLIAIISADEDRIKFVFEKEK